MWEKLNKVQVQVIIAVIIVCCCFGFLYLLALVNVPKSNEKLIDILGGIVIGTTLTPVMGWLYTMNKHNAPTKPTPPSP